MKCGEYGGETAKGRPCQRKAGWGTDASSGRCMYHHEARPRRSADGGAAPPPPEPPADLSPEAADVWRAVVAAWILGPEELLVLRGALESWDLYQDARATLRAEGTTIPSGGGGMKRHPAALVGRDAFRDYRSALGELGVSTEE